MYYGIVWRIDSAQDANQNKAEVLKFGVYSRLGDN